MTRKVGYVWHLRRLMAEQGMFATTDLVPLLAERGVSLSREQVYRLVTRTRNGSAWPLWPRCATSWDVIRVIWSSRSRPAGSLTGRAAASRARGSRGPARPRRARVLPDPGTGG